MAAPPKPRLDIPHLDNAVQFFCTQDIATSTRRTYAAALRKFSNFCTSFKIAPPLAVSEKLLCYFASYLAEKHLSPQTIKTYLSGVRHMLIVLGLPEPPSSQRLKLVQSGIERIHAQRPSSATKIRLPITPSILSKIQSHLLATSMDHDSIMLWAAAALCFFGFFRSGEITTPTLSTFEANKHLAWGDVAVDSPSNPQNLKVRLKFSKTDQLGRGVDIIVGKTGCLICPLAAVVAYMTTRGPSPGPFFRFRDGRPLTKSKFTSLIRQIYRQSVFHKSSLPAIVSALAQSLQQQVRAWRTP